MSSIILSIVGLVAALVLLTTHIAETNWILNTVLGVYLLLEGIYYLSKKSPIDAIWALIDLGSGSSLIILIFMGIPIFLTLPMAILLLIKSVMKIVPVMTE